MSKKTANEDSRRQLVLAQDRAARAEAAKLHAARIEQDSTYRSVHERREAAAAARELTRIRGRIDARVMRVSSIKAELDRIASLTAAVAEREPRRLEKLTMSRDELRLELQELEAHIATDRELLAKTAAVAGIQ